MTDSKEQPIPDRQSTIGKWLGQAVGALVLGSVLVGYLIALRVGMWPPSHPWSGVALVGAAFLNLLFPRPRGLRSAGLWIIAAMLTAAGAVLWLTATVTRASR